MKARSNPANRPHGVRAGLLSRSLVMSGLTLLLLAGATGTAQERRLSFRQAKKLMKRVYAPKERITFYCGCGYEYGRVDGKEKTLVVPATCGYRPRNPSPRSERVEWEHVMPAYRFGKDLTCWTEGAPGCRKPGRKCCRETDIRFRTMEADLHNLVPSVGELNADRGNRPYGIVPGEPRAYGACDFEVDFGRDVAEPAPGVRGDIARIYFYMSGRYDLPLTEEETARLAEWDRADPPDERERRRNRAIHSLQGNPNPFVKE